MNRRFFLKTASSAASLLAYSGVALPEATAAPSSMPLALAGSDPHLSWSVFSRNLQWLTTQAYAASNPYETGVLIGQACIKIGCSSVNLTVRPGGHVEPANVQTNLPQMLNGIRSTGIQCFEITTAINPPTDGTDTTWIASQSVHAIISTAAANGIQLYRIGTASYAPGTFGAAMTQQLDGLSVNLGRLAQVSTLYGGQIAAIYHTWDRANNQDIATAIWDFVYALNGIDPNLVGINFNIGHIFQDGPQDLWRINLRYSMPHIKGLGIQDVYWTKDPSTGVWSEVTPEAGGGMVPWVRFFQLLLQGGYSGPADLQIEYSVTGLRGQVVSLNNAFWADDPQFTSGNLSAILLIPSIKAQLNFYKDQATAAGWNATQMT